MFKDLRETIAAYQARDPAARSGLEIFLLYPGIKAVSSHRAAPVRTWASATPPLATMC